MQWELLHRDYEAVATGRRTALVLPLRPLQVRPGDRFEVVERGAPSAGGRTFVRVTDVQFAGDWQILSIQTLPAHVTIDTPGGPLQVDVNPGVTMSTLRVTFNQRLVATVSPDQDGTCLIHAYPQKRDVMVIDSVEDLDAPQEGSICGS